MGLQPALEGLKDREAIEAVRGFGFDVDGIRAWLEYYGYPGPRWGAKEVVVGRVGLVPAARSVVTGVMRGA